MKSWFPIVSACILLTAILSGCNKPEGLKTQSTYTFTNQTGRQITFDVYRTEEDYVRQQNRLYQYIIEPGASQQIVFEVAVKHWIDWYSAGYSFNNWQSIRSSYNRSIPMPELNIADQDQQFAINAATPDTSRSVFLNGDGSSSKWRCLVTNNPQFNGTYEFTFNKDFTCTYTYTNPGGGRTQASIEYYLASGTTLLGTPQSFVAYTTSQQQQTTSFRLTCNTGSLVTPHTGRDKILMSLNFGGFSQDYSLLRQ
jgi:hypothetical protein